MSTKSVKSEVLQESEPVFTGQLDSVKVTLSATQIKTLTTTVGIELIPAPGVGYAIEVVSAAVKYNYGTVAFNQTIYPNIKIDTATMGQGNFGYLNLTTAASKFQKMLYGGNPDEIQLVENKALKLYSQTAQATLGDGTMDLYILYRIITL